MRRMPGSNLRNPFHTLHSNHQTISSGTRTLRTGLTLRYANAAFRAAHRCMARYKHTGTLRRRDKGRSTAQSEVQGASHAQTVYACMQLFVTAALSVVAQSANRP